jgi:heme exporter protein A
MAGDGAAAPDRPVSLAVSGLGCLRGGKVLFRDLGFVLERGQALVVNGANGAGKSSLLRSLAGLLPWRAGQLQWCGHTLKPTDAAYAQRLAYLGHHSGMSDTLTGLENLRFALTLAEVPWDTGLVQQVLQQLALQDVVSRPLGRLSQGQRRRLALARVWLSQRPLWLLDEPDNSLDGEGCQRLVQMLDQHLEAGGLAVVVSHRGLALPPQHTQTLSLSAAAERAPALVQEAVPC